MGYNRAAAGYISLASSYTGSRAGTALTGTPGCSANVATPERRLYQVLIVDCAKTPLHGNTPNVGDVGVAKFFLTKPVQSQGSNDYIYSEFQSYVGTNNANKVSVTYHRAALPLTLTSTA